MITGYKSKNTGQLIKDRDMDITWEEIPNCKKKNPSWSVPNVVKQFTLGLVKYLWELKVNQIGSFSTVPEDTMQ